MTSFSVNIECATVILCWIATASVLSLCELVTTAMQLRNFRASLRLQCVEWELHKVERLQWRCSCNHCVMRWLQLRLDFVSPAVRLLSKDHKGHSDVTSYPQSRWPIYWLKPQCTPGLQSYRRATNGRSAVELQSSNRNRIEVKS